MDIFSGDKIHHLDLISTEKLQVFFSCHDPEEQKTRVTSSFFLLTFLIILLYQL